MQQKRPRFVIQIAAVLFFFIGFLPIAVFHEVGHLAVCHYYDGHHRFRACKELGIETRTETKTFDNELLEKKFVIEANLKRRHLSDMQRAELGIALEPIERELAKHRQLSTLKKGTERPLGSNEHNGEDQGKARDLVAKQVGLSPTTYQRAKTIIEKAPEELKEKVRKGETSISYAYKAINRTEKHKETPQASEVIKKYMGRRKSGSLFVSKYENTYPANVESLSEAIERLVHLAGLKDSDVQPAHGFRKFCRTAFENNGIHDDFAERLLGHKKERLKKVYSHPQPMELYKASEYYKAIDALTF